MNFDSPLGYAGTRTVWLLGHPVAHSLSPLIQNLALEHLKERLVYLAADVEEKHFRSAVAGLMSLGAVGANITVPHKELAYSLCDDLDPSARAIGACNVLCFKQERIWGYNTDGSGWLKAIGLVAKENIPARALVLGAGGASRAIVYSLLNWGVPQICIFNRSLERAEQLREHFLEGWSNRLFARPLSEFADNLTSSSLIVQTTSVGLDGVSSPVTLPSVLPKDVIFSELIYGHDTPFLRRARELGGVAQDGLPMLIYQAAQSLSIWLERPFEDIPVDLMLKRARAAHANQIGER